MPDPAETKIERGGNRRWRITNFSSTSRWKRPATACALEAESRRLESEKMLSADERAALDLERAGGFLEFRGREKDPRKT